MLRDVGGLNASLHKNWSAPIASQPDAEKMDLSRTQGRTDQDPDVAAELPAIPQHGQRGAALGKMNEAYVDRFARS